MIEFKKNNYLLNEEINKYLKKIIKYESYANGYIFYGAEGVGKKQTALQFIKEIFKQTSPIGNIEERINNNNHPDFLMIDPSSSLEAKKSKNSDSEKRNIGSEIIKIAQIRNIKNFLGQKSVESTKKVVLLVDAHLLNEASSNCLLKTLEEPNNGIFILLTSKLNFLLDTIISRCQLVRFKSLSGKKIELFLKGYLESTKLNLSNKLDFQDLVNLANGSPGQLLKICGIWNELSDEITSKLENPTMNSLEIIEVSKLISEQLEINQQICLVNLLQLMWWRKTKNKNLVREFENLKSHMKNNVQPRLAWEVTFFKILMENL
tara:strand:+ start:75 stop:1034 length:960 start_codon:yes stop_codon:yes gene_type:complete